jgi:plasmid replication initiation protein
MFGILDKTDSGSNYNSLRQDLLRLRNRGAWVTLADGTESIVSWIAKSRMSRKTGLIEIKLDEDLAPYLLGLKRDYTTYELQNIFNLSSSFSIRLYELLRSYGNLKEKEIPLEEIKLCLNATAKSWETYADFKRGVLDKAIKEINKKTDLNISCKPIKKGYGGRKVTDIEFTIDTKIKEEPKPKVKKSPKKTNELTEDEERGIIREIEEYKARKAHAESQKVEMADNHYICKCGDALCFDNECGTEEN